MEAALYHETVKGRVGIIREYQKLVDENVLERILQQKLFDHLWLLDPSWDRATGVTVMETTVTNFLRTDRGLLSKEIEDSRMDIVFRHFGGTHAVIEMKRPEVPAKVFRLLEQIQKYRTGLKAHLSAQYQVRNPFIKTYILVKKEPEDWKDADTKAEETETLHRYDAQILTYRSLLQNALSTYQQFLSHDADVARLSRLMQKIQDEIEEMRSIGSDNNASDSSSGG